MSCVKTCSVFGHVVREPLGIFYGYRYSWIKGWDLSKPCKWAATMGLFHFCICVKATSTPKTRFQWIKFDDELLNLMV